MSGFAFPCAKCGCRPGCLIVRDRFTRDASTDLGSLWAEIAGDASVGPDIFSDGSKLLMPSTGIVECTQAAPAPAGTDGHGCRWTVMWGNLVSISRFLRIHVIAC